MRLKLERLLIITKHISDIEIFTLFVSMEFYLFFFLFLGFHVEVKTALREFRSRMKLTQELILTQFQSVRFWLLFFFLSFCEINHPDTGLYHCFSSPNTIWCILAIRWSIISSLVLRSYLGLRRLALLLEVDMNLRALTGILFMLDSWVVSHVLDVNVFFLYHFLFAQCPGITLWLSLHVLNVSDVPMSFLGHT